MAVAHYRIYELDLADHVVEGYSVICRSDTAALTMASKCAANHATAVAVWEGRTRAQPRLMVERRKACVFESQQQPCRQ